MNVQVVTLTSTQLQELVQGAVCDALNKFINEQRTQATADEDLLSKSQARALAKVSNERLTKALRDGELPAVVRDKGRGGHHNYLVRRADVLAWAKGAA
ncbi:MAG: DNA-binding protein [Planctomycetota bacterium]|nr:MAG: DNA-binding protein [Planctomycetota bacterium]